MTALQAGNSKPLEPSAQIIEGEVIFKKEHKVIYDAFIQLLKYKEQSEELNKDDKAALAFILDQNQTIFKNVTPEDIKPLSEENFSQFLLSVFEKIREKKLANKENLENGEIKKVVDECASDIRGTEAKESLIKLIGLPFGIKIDPKNISSSFVSGIKEKIPFLGGGEKKDEPPLSDEEMVTTFLRKIFLPVLFSIASILIFGPTTFAIVAAAIGTIFAIKGGSEVLFSNNKKGTLYNPHSQDENDAKKRGELNEKIFEGINDILKTPAKEAEKDDVTIGKQSAPAEESEQSAQVNQVEQSSWQKKMNGQQAVGNVSAQGKY